ncbi:MAG: hypothetical protein ACRDFS_10325 [Chloroflexota bacterium]
MADFAIQNEAVRYRGKPDWGAIWAGVFAFAAIWSIFGLLGEAIFATNASPNAANPVTGMGIGMGIWGIVLTIIAMYVAGRVTTHFSDSHTHSDSVMHATTMFGLSVISVVIIVALSGAVLSGGEGVAGGAHSSYMLTVFADLGWIGFVALFLGWLGAIGGALQGGMAAESTQARRIDRAA